MTAAQSMRSIIKVQKQFTTILTLKVQHRSLPLNHSRHRLVSFTHLSAGAITLT